MTTDDLKQCTKCGEWKSLAEFYRHKRAQSGLTARCRVCVIADALTYRENNKEKVLERERAYKRANREKVLEGKRAYRKTHADKRDRKEYQKEYYQRKRKHIQRYASVFSTEQRRKQQLATNKWRREHPDFRKASDNSRQAAIRGNGGRFTTRQWRALVAFYAPTGNCLCCGEIGSLTTDHVIPIARGGRNDIGNLQPLCMRCNCKKGALEIDYRSDKGEFARSLLDSKTPGPLTANGHCHKV